jgi:hypothetical protein
MATTKLEETLDNYQYFTRLTPDSLSLILASSHENLRTRIIHLTHTTLPYKRQITFHFQRTDRTVPLRIILTKYMITLVYPCWVCEQQFRNHGTWWKAGDMPHIKPFMCTGKYSSNTLGWKLGELQRMLCWREESKLYHRDLNLGRSCRSSSRIIKSSVFWRC